MLSRTADFLMSWWLISHLLLPLIDLTCLFISFPSRSFPLLSMPPLSTSSVSFCHSVLFNFSCHPKEPTTLHLSQVPCEWPLSLIFASCDCIFFFEVKCGGINGPVSFQPKHTGCVYAPGSPKPGTLQRHREWSRHLDVFSLASPWSTPGHCRLFLYSPLVAFCISLPGSFFWVQWRTGYSARDLVPRSHIWQIRGWGWWISTLALLALKGTMQGPVYTSSQWSRVAWVLVVCHGSPLCSLLYLIPLYPHNTSWNHLPHQHMPKFLSQGLLLGKPAPTRPDSYAGEDQGNTNREGGMNSIEGPGKWGPVQVWSLLCPFPFSVNLPQRGNSTFPLAI